MANTLISKASVTFSRYLYSLVWLLLLPFLLVNWLSKLIKYGGVVAKEYLSRFGLCFKSIPKNGFWIHCASVGEVVAVQQLVERLIRQYPDVSIVMTTNTMTGRERVTQLFSARVNHLYLPYDFPLFIHLVLTKLQPRMLLITEMELWPNLCHGSHSKKIPVYLVNGRMSEKSKMSYQKLAWLIKPLLTNLDGICAQGSRDVENYLALGISPEKIVLTNNIKFDLHINQQDYAAAAQLVEQFHIQNRVILVAGSTHEPEEQLVLDAYHELVKQVPNLLLIIVPRHPQRFEQVSSLLNKQNIQFIRLSETRQCDATTQVVLADKMGLLRPLYTLANVAFVGGSVAQKGGHNALEPAAVGVPVAMGRSIFNNPQICQMLEQAGVLIFIDNYQQLKEVCLHWLNDPEAYKVVSAKAKQVVAQNKGAIDQTFTFLGLL